MTRVRTRRRGAIVMTILAVAAIGCGSSRPPGKRIPRGPMPLVLPALDGGDIDLAEHRGAIVVLHAFTTWSMGATGDVEQLRDAHQPRGDVRVIGIALDLEGFPVVSPWRTALDVGYLIALADDPFRAGNSPLGKIASVPTTIVLDRRGHVVRWIDRPLRPGELARLIAEVLSSPP
jgi:hypothetical protein